MGVCRCSGSAVMACPLMSWGCCQTQLYALSSPRRCYTCSEEKQWLLE